MHIYKIINEETLIKFLCIPLMLALFLVAVSPVFHQAETVLAFTAIEEITEKVFVLDAGHGGEDCGTIGSNGTYEKDLNFAITMELGRYLTDMGYRVIYTRTRDALLYSDEENIKGLRKIFDLKNRAKVASTVDDAIFISIHMNSYSDPKYNGLQVFYGLKNEKSASLAYSVQASVIKDLQPQNRRKIRSGENIYLMENLSCPSILIECGFLSNAEECEKLCQKEYQKQLCFAIVCGIIEEIEKNEI